MYNVVLDAMGGGIIVFGLIFIALIAFIFAIAAASVVILIILLRKKRKANDREEYEAYAKAHQNEEVDKL